MLDQEKNLNQANQLVSWRFLYVVDPAAMDSGHTVEMFLLTDRP